MTRVEPLEKRILPQPRDWKKILGVGIVVVGMAMGTGELIMWPHLVTRYGLAILWLGLVGISIQYFINQEVARGALIITFEDVENSYQQKTLGFDLVIGFVGGESVSDSVSSSHGVREDEGVVAGAVTEKQSLIERVQTYVSSFFDDEIGGEVKEVQIENVEKEGVENSSEEMVVVYDQSKDSSEEEGGVSIALILLIIVAIIIVVILLLPR